MKTTIRLFTLLILVAGLVSCEGLKNLADVEFDTDLGTDLDIDVPGMTLKSTLEGIPFSAEAKLDPTSDPEVAKYADKIQGYQVNSIKATVKQVSKEGIELLAGTYFQISDATETVMWALSESFSVKVGNSYTLENEMGKWDMVQKILAKNSEFTVSTSGESNNELVTIVIELSIGATVTANPL